MVKSGCSVAAIIVVDLARELYERGVVNADDVQAIDSDLYSNMQALILQQDLSEVIEECYPEAWPVALWRCAQTGAGPTQPSDTHTKSSRKKASSVLRVPISTPKSSFNWLWSRKACSQSRHASALVVFLRGAPGDQLQPG